MKKLELYQCEICGTNYKSKEECEKCERHHVTNGIIVDAKYNSMDRGSTDGLPEKISVKFASGKIATYRRWPGLR